MVHTWAALLIELLTFALYFSDTNLFELTKHCEPVMTAVKNLHVYSSIYKLILAIYHNVIALVHIQNTSISFQIMIISQGP